jgi:lauroyl/myristoyl acyltransferase
VAAAVTPGAPTLGQRLRVRVLIAGVAILRHLPDGPVYRLAHAAGVLLSYLLHERRALVRSNLGRVCRWLDANGMAAPRVQAAARDGRKLDALVRDAFGHWVVAYVESAMAARYDAAGLRARMELTDVATAERSLAASEPGDAGRIFLGLHFGSVEIAALYAARVGHVPVSGPMERVSDPAMREYFERVRGAFGVTLVQMSDAATELTACLARGEAVAIVADRTISGQGSRVELFGRPARLPAGGAVLAVESGARVIFLAVQRTRPGHWRARVEEFVVPADGSRRERVRTVLEVQARTFERFIADAPEQWWTLFFPIWEHTGEA